MAVNWSIAVGLMATALAAVAFGIAVLETFGRNRQNAITPLFADQGGGTVFLFDGETLFDSSPSGRAVLVNSPIRGGHWARLMAFLAPHFPELETKIADLPQLGAITLTSQGKRRQPLLLTAEHKGGLTRICVIDPDSDETVAAMDPLTHRANSDELALLRDMAGKSPFLIWRETSAHQVIWANTSYILFAASSLQPGQDIGWPLPKVFENASKISGVEAQRLNVQVHGQTRWFDVTFFDHDGIRTYYATPIDSAVHAETALREFMQTLTKTFAHLPIGLAIFDQNRALQLFNPALLDLTALPPDFLSRRPTLLAVLDAMRERNKLPEPKDYKSWRRQLVDMERAAASGLYEETWNLADGQTYRVVGRPHPNGALALMIEDISGEVLRTRRYRADLEMGQAVIDEMDVAVAVFSQTGRLLMSNVAYAQLWGHDPLDGTQDHSVRFLADHWRSLSAPTSLWADIEDYAATVGDRDGWVGEARLLDGRLLQCKLSPLTSGATFAAFKSLTPLGQGAPHLANAEKRRHA